MSNLHQIKFACASYCVSGILSLWRCADVEAIPLTNVWALTGSPSVAHSVKEGAAVNLMQTQMHAH